MTVSLARRRLRAASLSLALSLAPVVVPPLVGTVTMLAPISADARPGMGGSMGSRGSRTYSAPPPTATNPGGASPFGRTMTPNPGQYGAPGYGAAARPHPFAAGLAGGLLGAGIGGLLFGHHGAYADGYGERGSGAGSFIWLLIELAILFFLGRWLYRRFFANRSRSPVTGGLLGGMPMRGAGQPMRGGAPIQIGNADYRAFEQTLLDVQQAWSMQDLRSLSRFATAEMVSYFSEQLSDLASRNLRNVVSAVSMDQGDLSEAWAENGREFATVAMRYSMIDVTTDLTGRVVDGSPNERQTVTELWTFVRAPSGSWLLSAIQQAR